MSQAMLFVAVCVFHVVPTPKRTCLVPLKEQVPHSLAQGVHAGLLLDSTWHVFT